MKLQQSRTVNMLLLFYAFLVPLGNLARFGEVENDQGISTVLLLLIVAIGFFKSLPAIRRESLLFSWLILISWMLIASWFAVKPFAAFINTATLGVYLLAAAIAYRYIDNPQSIIRLLQAYCLGGLLSAGATLIDFLGLIDIPRINEITIATSTDAGYINQASGAFTRRSAMATYYTMIIAIGFLVPWLNSWLSAKQKILFLLTGFICMLTLMLTHNRGGILASIISSLFIFIVVARNPVSILKFGSTAFVVVALLAYSVFSWFSEIWIAYQALLGVGYVAPSDPYLHDQSDWSRIIFFEHTIISLMENPFGHGYSLLSGLEDFPNSLVDPHSIFSQIIWGAGLFGVFWILYFIFHIINASRILLRKNIRHAVFISIGLSLMGPLIAFIIFGMAHTVISTGIAWVFFGVYLKTLHHLRCTLTTKAKSNADIDYLP